MAWGVSDELLPVILPVAAYWTTSGIYQLMLRGSAAKHRMFTSEEESARNLVSRTHVLVRVLLHQTMQMTLAAAVFLGAGGKRTAAAASAAGQSAPTPGTTSVLHVARQVAVAMLFIDAWQYSWHRLTHTNKFLYKHVHSVHHRMVVPYAYGAQFFHPVDAFVGEIVGSVTATLVSGMAPRTAAVFFSVLTVKGVDDHCGMWFPRNHPFHRFLCNNSAFHASHHQLGGFKYNFSAYFFANWDKLLGTYMPYSVQERKGGGYELRAASCEKIN